MRWQTPMTTRKSDEAVRSGMNVAVGVVVLLDKTLKPVTPGETRHEGVSETGPVC
jgi:hypothetical protein